MAWTGDNPGIAQDLGSLMFLETEKSSKSSSSASALTPARAHKHLSPHLRGHTIRRWPQPTNPRSTTIPRWNSPGLGLVDVSRNREIIEVIVIGICIDAGDLLFNADADDDDFDDFSVSRNINEPKSWAIPGLSPVVCHHRSPRRSRQNNHPPFCEKPPWPYASLPASSLA
jgi:hypothetical protein